MIDRCQIQQRRKGKYNRKGKRKYKGMTHPSQDNNDSSSPRAHESTIIIRMFRSVGTMTTSLDDVVLGKGVGNQRTGVKKIDIEWRGNTSDSDEGRRRATKDDNVDNREGK